MNIDAVKKAEQIKEIEDAENHIKELLGMNKLNELQSYLEEELMPKYFIEIAVYNTINTARPTSIEQNANNALVFLDKLKIEKTAELLVNKSN